MRLAQEAQVMPVRSREIATEFLAPPVEPRSTKPVLVIYCSPPEWLVPAPQASVTV